MIQQQQSKTPNWLPYLGLIVAVASIVYQSGQITSEIDQNTARIAKLEASDQVRLDAVNSTNVRLARIEAKLDYIKPEPKQ